MVAVHAAEVVLAVVLGIVQSLFRIAQLPTQ